MDKQQRGITEPNVFHFKKQKLQSKLKKSATAEWTHTALELIVNMALGFAVWCSVTLSILVEGCYTLLGVYVVLSANDKHLRQNYEPKQSLSNHSCMVLILIYQPFQGFSLMMDAMQAWFVLREILNKVFHWKDC